MDGESTEGSNSNRRRRGLTVSIKQSLRELRTGLLEFNQAVVEKLGLRSVDLDCLDLINALGPVGPSELARRTNLHPATVTGILDRLEKGGWIVRERDANDRRAVVVRARKERNPELLGLLAGMSDRMDDICARYSEAELEAILDFLKRTAIAGSHSARDLAEGGHQKP